MSNDNSDFVVYSSSQGYSVPMPKRIAISLAEKYASEGQSVRVYELKHYTTYAGAT